MSIRQEDQDKTSFTSDWDTFAFKRMPFGLCNAPGTFQRIMMIIFQDYLRKILEIFIDDFCVYSSERENLAYLKQNFERCCESGLRLHPWKCYFDIRKGQFLGHIVSRKGIELDADKVKVIKSLRQPTNLRELRAFLGHSEYYRSIKNMQMWP